MNNKQKAEEYAAKILESNHTSCWGVVEWRDALTKAVLHGIEIGYVNGLKAARHLPGEAYEDDSNTPPIKADWQSKQKPMRGGFAEEL